MFIPSNNECTHSQSAPGDLFVSWSRFERANLLSVITGRSSSKTFWPAPYSDLSLVSYGVRCTRLKSSDIQIQSHPRASRSRRLYHRAMFVKASPVKEVLHESSCSCSSLFSIIAMIDATHRFRFNKRMASNFLRPLCCATPYHNPASIFGAVVQRQKQQIAGDSHNGKSVIRTTVSTSCVSRLT